MTKQSDRHVKLVSTYAGSSLRRNLMLFDSINGTLDVIELKLPANAPDSTALRDSLRRTLDQHRPAAIVVFDGGSLAFTAAALAKRHDVRVLHVGGGVRAADTAKQTDDLSDIVYTCDADAAAQLFKEGFSERRVVSVGSLLADTFSNTPAKPSLTASLVRADLSFLSAAPFDDGYALVQLNQPANTENREVLISLMSILRHISKELPLVWPVASRVAQHLEAVHSRGQAELDRVAYLDELPYTQFADLICNAVCVITDSWNVQEEATAVGTPCITIGMVRERTVTSRVGSNASAGMDSHAAVRAVWDCMFNGAKRGAIPDLWDGKAASRLVVHLLSWLAAPQR